MVQKSGRIILDGVKSHVPALMEKRGIENAYQLHSKMKEAGISVGMGTCYKYAKGMVPMRTDAIENLARFFNVEMGEITSLNNGSELSANA